MARFLALDWDHNQLHLVAADVRGGTVRIQRAVVWRESQSPNPAEAENLGKLLRERLKEAGITPAPVLACIGRDRVILKDIRHPAVPDYEEPAVVRFQAIKEITDPPDEVVIDYTPAGSEQRERRALVLVARRELVHAYRDLCQAAGLKLAALTPRPFGIIACLSRLNGQVPTDGAVAILAVSEKWAEFCVARGETVLFARSLAVGPSLPGEVRRSLAVYNGQAAEHPVRTVYVAGGDEHAPFRESLQNLLGIPVHSFDPLAGAEKADVPDGSRGAFAGAVGLLSAQAKKYEQAVNFVQPKQPRPPRDANRVRVLVAALAGVLLMGSLVALGYWRLSFKDQQVAEMNFRLSELERRERDLQHDVKGHTDLKKWSDSENVWLDQFYDFTAMFPDTKDIQLKHITGGEFSGSAKEKEYVTKMMLKGVIPRGNQKPAQELRASLYEDKFYRPGPVEDPASRPGFGRTQEFVLKVDAKKRPPTEYKREIVVPADAPKAKESSKKGFRPGGAE